MNYIIATIILVCTEILSFAMFGVSIVKIPTWRFLLGWLVICTGVPIAWNLTKTKHERRTEDSSN